MQQNIRIKENNKKLGILEMAVIRDERKNEKILPKKRKRSLESNHCS